MVGLGVDVPDEGEVARVVRHESREPAGQGGQVALRVLGVRRPFGMRHRGQAGEPGVPDLAGRPRHHGLEGLCLAAGEVVVAGARGRPPHPTPSSVSGSVWRVWRTFARR